MSSNTDEIVEQKRKKKVCINCFNCEYKNVFIWDGYCRNMNSRNYNFRVNPEQKCDIPNEKLGFVNRWDRNL